jgi:hypothetical protein
MDVPELAAAGGGREVGDQGGRGDERRIEAILDGAIGGRDGQMRFARAARPADDEGMATRDELGREGAAEEGEADPGLKRKVVLVDGLEKRKARSADAALDARWARCATSSAIRMARYSRYAMSSASARVASSG